MPREPARAHAQYQKAYDAISAKDWAQARRLLYDLWKRSPTYDVAATLAQVEYQLKNYSVAARYMAFAISNAAPKESPRVIERFKTALEQIKTHVATIKVTVNTTPAEIRVDGASVESSPFGIFVDPGMHTVEARHGGDEPVSKTLQVAAGRTYSVDLTLQPAEQPPSPSPAAGPAPTIKDTGLPTAAEQPPDTDSTKPPLVPGVESHRNLAPAYVGAAIVLAGAGVALGFGLAAKAAHNDVNASEPTHFASDCTAGAASSGDCTQARDTYDRQRLDSTLSDIGIGVAVVGGLATVAYLLFWPNESTTIANSNLIPSANLNRSGASVTIVGRF